MASFKILIITIKTSTQLSFCRIFVNKDKGKECMKLSTQAAQVDPNNSMNLSWSCNSYLSILEQTQRSYAKENTSFQKPFQQQPSQLEVSMLQKN